MVSLGFYLYFSHNISNHEENNISSTTPQVSLIEKKGVGTLSGFESENIGYKVSIDIGIGLDALNNDEIEIDKEKNQEKSRKIKFRNRV